VRTLQQRAQAAIDAGFTNGDMAKAAGVSSGAVSQWISGETKSLKASSAHGLEKLTGWRSEWWSTGKPPKEVSGLTKGAHAMSLPGGKVVPPTIDWGALMSTDLGDEFETALPDNAMAPDAPKGARCIFVTGIEPQAGDWVLAFDADGNYYCREYRLLKPGRWELHAMNSAFLPLDSERDGLEVVAVFDGMRGRRAPR
jgi:hypothetical protein